MIGQTQKDYSLLSDMQLKQAMMFAQRSNNTPEFLQLMTEANKRKQMRQAATGEQAGQQLAQGPQTQADAVMSGIANLAAPSDEQGYASGGIVAFSEGGTSRAGRYIDEFIERSNKEKAAELFNNRREAVLAATAQAQRELEQRQAKEADTANSWLGFFTTPESVYKNPAYTPRTLSESRNYGNEGMRGRAAPPATSAAAVTEYGLGNEGRRSGQVTALAANQPPRVTPSANGGAAGAGGSAARVGKTATTATAPAAVPDEKAPEYTAPSLAQLLADRKTAAAEGEAGIKALMDPYAAKIEERRKALAGETASTAGLLGLKADWFGDDKRRALRNFGLALMAGKDPNAMVNIGTAGKAAAEAYEAEKEKRQARMDALDDRDQKLALARYEMSRGNRDEADRLVKQVEEGNYRVHGSKMDAFKERMRQRDSALDRDLKREEMAQRERLTKMQIGAAGRNSQLELYSALGGGDVKKGFEFAQTARGEPAADLALWKTYAADPIKLELLKGTNKALYDMVIAKIASQGGGYVDAPAKGSTVLPR